MAELPKDLRECLDEYEPPVDEAKIEALILGKLSASEAREVAVLTDGCKTWYRAYGKVLAQLTQSRASAAPLV